MRDNIVPPSCRSKARSSRSKGIRLADEFVRESRVIHLGTCWQRNHVPRDCSCKVGPETIVSSMHLKSPLGVARKTESENLHIYNRTTGRNSMGSKDDLSDRFINRIGSFWRNFLPFLASKLLLI